MSSTTRPLWIAAALAAGGAAAMSVAAWVSGLPAVVPSLGPSLLLAATLPGQRESAPATLLVGHGIAAVAAVASLAAFGLLHEPSALVAGVTVARMVAIPLALALTLAGMLLVGRFHAPAGATTLLVALGVVRAGGDLVALVAATVYVAGVVALFPWAAARLARRTARVRRRQGARRRALGA
jgi:hypothetical protein